MRPDQWTHKAAIVTENSGCRLNELGGNVISMSSRHLKGGHGKVTVHHEGDTFETEDSIGDTYEHFLTQGGYRLTCERFPAGFSIQIVFALAALKPEYAPHNMPDPGRIMFADKDFGPTDDVFGLILSSKPSSSLVAVDGHYKLGMRTYSISRNVKVKGEN
jgi:hemin uptake protein HemP